ncbi:MAG: Rieske 2Fe-2S domain-containing protein [Zavarzinella sp.]
MARFTIATTADVPHEGCGCSVEIAGKIFAVFRQGDEFFVVDNVCSHRAAPLHESGCENFQITCPWHGAKFDVRTGEHLNPPASTGILSYPVLLVGEEIQIEM